MLANASRNFDGTTVRPLRISGVDPVGALSDFRSAALREQQFVFQQNKEYRHLSTVFVSTKPHTH